MPDNLVNQLEEFGARYIETCNALAPPLPTISRLSSPFKESEGDFSFSKQEAPLDSLYRVLQPHRPEQTSMSPTTSPRLPPLHIPQARSAAKGSVFCGLRQSIHAGSHYGSIAGAPTKVGKKTVGNPYYRPVARKRASFTAETSLAKEVESGP